MRIAKPGIVRLDADGMRALRRLVFNRSEGCCERCKRRITWDSFHLAHIKARGAGGDDTPGNTLALCGDSQGCHMKDDHNPRSVPAKA